ncbi:hypothetical protein [Xylophilus ampelinus]|uniref:Phage replication protein P n=1 Tax=Xylophilus ampelinus TaxID=54067 RepID=A0A318SQV5_9BURK|nr:hypothetical protein [Xylophilus ampelinus]MCS4508903.1 hypothetical protein [Xylophilus ampelinus]PYE79470.1 hypothetical protein DFQ15_102203 [Xylophilus ampelinus]
MQHLTTALSMPTPESSPERLPLSQLAVAQVFKSLGAQLGAKMADMYRGVEPIVLQAEWAERLSDLKRHELERGVAACADRRFAPTLGEFRQLCRPALDPETAWLEAAAGMREREAGRMGQWTHPAVWRAAHEMAHELRTKAFADCRKRWEWTMQRELASGWGAPVPPPLPLIEDDTKVGPPSSAVRERMARILASAGRARAA